MTNDPVFRALDIDVSRQRDRLPEPLRPLADVVWNVAWVWLPDGTSLFEDIDASLWEACGHNPRAMLDRASPRRLAELALDSRFVRRVNELAQRLRAYLERPISGEAEELTRKYDGHPVAYFSAEFGLHESLPLYSGGLGILAGDHLKSASDLGLPLVGVGLRYRQGYFQQSLDRSGWQVEQYADTDFGSLPVGLLLQEDGTPVTVQVSIQSRTVTLQLWGIRVGRVPLLLLDSNRDDNHPDDRWITGHLYGGDRNTRLAQEMVLGIAGVRALRKLGYDPAVLHMNEGHAAFLGLELIREGVTRGQSLEEAVNAARKCAVFTTHTPVAAGHDEFHPDQFAHFMDGYLEEFETGRFPVSREKLLALGRVHPENRWESFGMTPLAMHASRKVNGVSRLHGRVCREMWQPLWPEKRVEDVPITHVTNGVHLGTWMASAWQELLDRYLGQGWEERQRDPATWNAIDQIPDAELWAVHQALKARLVQYARGKVRTFRLTTGANPEYVEAAEGALDPNALTLGFARRVATYKRLNLLLQDPERALGLLGTEDRPVQIILAGKAHPGDAEAKAVLQRLLQVRTDPRVVRRGLFLVDYNISVAREMTQGVDVWLNMPRRPLEASGTSGMKAMLNGALNCSILDGWWAEGYNGENGWAVGSEAERSDAQGDAEDAAALYRTLEEQVIPLYYQRDKNGIPAGWIAQVKNSLKSLGPVFVTERMVAEYAREIY